MKNTSRLLILLTMILILWIQVNAQMINFRKDSLEQVMADARIQNKIIFVDAYTTWCGPCKWMDKNVFTDTQVADFYNQNFINFKIDMEKGEGPAIGQTYEVNAYPTFLYIDGQGDVIHKKMGSMPPAEFIKAGESAMDPENNVRALVKRYENGERSPEFIQQYVQVLTSAYMDVSHVAEEYVNMMPKEKLFTEETLMVLLGGMDGMDHPFFQVLAENQKEYEKVVNPEMVSQVLTSYAKGEIFSAIQRRDAALLQKRRAQISLMDGAIREEVLLFADMTKSKYEKNYQDYLKYAKAFAKKFMLDDWSKLNQFAWEIYEDDHAGKKYLKFGEKLAKKSILMNSNAYNNDTYAALLYKRGKYPKAKEYALSAIQLAKDAEEDASASIELLQKIEQKM